MNLPFYLRDKTNNIIQLEDVQDFNDNFTDRFWKVW